MILWLTRDGFAAALMGIVVVLAFVGYNAARSLKRRYTIVRREGEETKSRWN